MLYEKGTYKKNYEVTKEYDSITSKKCKCGHIVCFKMRSGYNLCSWCGRINFIDKKSEFNYYIKRRYGR